MEPAHNLPQPQIILPPGTSADEVVVQPLGSGGEVGRSAVLVSFKGRKVLFDCGVHPAKKGIDSLPYFDAVNCKEIDLVLVTHFHLDHCGSLPYLCEQTGFEGRVFMTRDTKAFYKMVMNDFMNVGTSSQHIVSKEWLKSTVERIETIEYHEEKVHNGIRFQPFNAGHVLGAAMFQVDIAGVKVLYTGDFSTAEDRHLPAAEVPPISPDVLIVESTYGIQVHESAKDRENKFLGWVDEVVSRGGRCLVPVFALGRAQELLLILEEYWKERPALQKIPIYYASSLATKCMSLYKQSIGSMNERVRAQHDANENPFEFKYISPLKDLSHFEDTGPCVVLASPGMMQSGISLELFERWCGNRLNGVIVAGYCVDGTIAKEVLNKPREIQKDDGQVLHVRMGTIESVSFSAHSDGRQTKQFIKKLGDIQHVILVHGSQDSMSKLHDKLTEDFQYRNVEVYKTQNKEEIRLPFNIQRSAKVLGKLASSGAAQDGDIVQGALLVSGNHKHSIVHPDDISTFTGLEVSKVQQALVIPVPRMMTVHDILTTLQSYFAGTELTRHVKPKKGFFAEANENIIEIAGNVAVKTNDSEHVQTVTVMWMSSRTNDLIADATCIAILQMLEQNDDEDQRLPLQVPVDTVFRMKCFHRMISQFFTNVKTELGAGETIVTTDEGIDVRIRDCLEVSSMDGSKLPPATFNHVASIVKRIFVTLFAVPIESGWCDCGMAHGDEVKHAEVIKS